MLSTEFVKNLIFKKIEFIKISLEYSNINTTMYDQFINFYSSNFYFYSNCIVLQTKIKQNNFYKFLMRLKKKKKSKAKKSLTINIKKKKNKEIFKKIKELKKILISKENRCLVNYNTVKRKTQPHQLKKVSTRLLDTNKKIYNPLNSDCKFNFIFSDFFSKIFKNKIFIINFNYFLKVKILKFNKMVKNFHRKSFFFKKTVYVYKILKIMMASLLFKDAKLVIYMIKEIFEHVHYSKHKTYLIFWRNIIKQLLPRYYKKLGIFGVRLSFHGKLGVGGNSKKRALYISMGRCSNSTKYLKIDSAIGFYRTETGVSGFRYSIYY